MTPVAQTSPSDSGAAPSSHDSRAAAVLGFDLGVPNVTRVCDYKRIQGSTLPLPPAPCQLFSYSPARASDVWAGRMKSSIGVGFEAAFWLARPNQRVTFGPPGAASSRASDAWDAQAFAGGPAAPSLRHLEGCRTMSATQLAATPSPRTGGASQHAALAAARAAQEGVRPSERAMRPAGAAARHTTPPAPRRSGASPNTNRRAAAARRPIAEGSTDAQVHEDGDTRQVYRAAAAWPWPGR